MNYTTNYKLLKPSASDYFSISHFNQNADIIDAALAAIPDNIATQKNVASARNLLINAGPFQGGNIISQRGELGYYGGGFCIDRWFIANGLECNPNPTVNPKWLTVFIDTPHHTFPSFYQEIENPEALAGKTITLTFETTNVNLSELYPYICLGNMVYRGGSIPKDKRGYATMTLTLPSSLSDQRLLVGLEGVGDGNPNPRFQLFGAKLEVGETSTYAQSSPVDIITELLRCQRYCFAADSDLRMSSLVNSKPTFKLMVPTAMRVVPKIVGDAEVCSLDGSTVKLLSDYTITQHYNTLTIIANNCTLTDGYLSLKNCYFEAEFEPPKEPDFYAAPLTTEKSGFEEYTAITATQASFINQDFTPYEEA